VRINAFMEFINILFLTLENSFSLFYLSFKLNVSALELRFCRIILILHRQDVLVDWNLIF